MEVKITKAGQTRTCRHFYKEGPLERYEIIELWFWLWGEADGNNFACEVTQIGA